MPNTLAQTHRVVEAMPLATDAAGRTSDWISLKNVVKCTAIVQITQGNAATVAVSLLQATNVSGGSSKAGPAVPIWSNLDTSTIEDLTRRTDGASYTTDSAVKNKIVVLDIDPSQLDVENGFDCIALTTGASNVANITGAMFICEMRYQGATLPAVTTN